MNIRKTSIVWRGGSHLSTPPWLPSPIFFVAATSRDLRDSFHGFRSKFNDLSFARRGCRWSGEVLASVSSSCLACWTLSVLLASTCTCLLSPQIERDFKARGDHATDPLVLSGGSGDRSAHLRADLRPPRAAEAAALGLCGVRRRLRDLRVYPLDRVTDPRPIRHEAWRASTGMVVARAIVRDSFEEADSSRIYSMLMLVIGIARCSPRPSAAG